MSKSDMYDKENTQVTMTQGRRDELEKTKRLCESTQGRSEDR
jgi:hypothetical protein